MIVVSLQALCMWVFAMIANHYWKNDSLVRGLVWDRMKAAVLRRDRYQCQDCRTDFGGRRRRVWDPSLHRGRGGHRWDSLEVHHIIPRAEGGGDHPGNLKTLCSACHASYTREHSATLAARRRERAVALRELGDEEFFYDPRD
jgi:5-methylcytosine-specific restriction protein A